LGCWTFDQGDATDLTSDQRHGALRGTPRFSVEAQPKPADLLAPAQVEGALLQASQFSTATLRSTDGTSFQNLLGASSRFRFTVFNPPASPFELTITEGDRFVTRRNIFLSVGERLQLDLTLAEAGTISGTLRMFDGTPHVVVPVQILKATNAVVATVLSDASGRFTFTNVPPAVYQVRCQVLGGYRYLGVDRRITYGELASPAGLREARTIRLNPGQSVERADFTFAPFRRGLGR